MSRFLLITHIAPPAVDGGSKVIHKLGQYFKNQGHDILTLSSDASSTDDFTHKYPKQNNKGLPVYTIFHRPLKKISKVLGKGPIFKLIPFVKFVITCLKFKPNYIIAGPLPTTAILYARLFKKLTGAKLIINASFHHTDPEFQQPILTKALQSVDYIWTLTDFETNYFHKNFHIPPSKLINVGNGVDSSFLIKNLKLKIKNLGNLLFIGSFAAHKGIDTLIAAHKLLPNFSLTLAGQKTLYTPNFDKSIKLIYNFKSANLSKILDNCTILISPSTQESFGLVLIEAWARGIPVIAANIPASAELINKSGGGLLFEPNNPQDLANKIVELQSSHINYGLHGYKYVKTNYTWDKIGETIWQKISS